jgi:hypothetical protein
MIKLNLGLCYNIVGGVLAMQSSHQRRAEAMTLAVAWLPYYLLWCVFVLLAEAFRWDLFQDATDPARIALVFLVESWLDHLRQHEGVTEADRTIQEHLLALHQADTPPACPSAHRLRSYPPARHR